MARARSRRAAEVPAARSVCWPGRACLPAVDSRKPRSLIFDSNVVLDLLDAAPGSPSLALLERHRRERRIVINEIIFAEISSRFREFALVRETCEAFGLEIE